MSDSRLQWLSIVHRSYGATGGREDDQVDRLRNQVESVWFLACKLIIVFILVSIYNVQCDKSCMDYFGTVDLHFYTSYTNSGGKL